MPRRVGTANPTLITQPKIASRESTQRCDIQALKSLEGNLAETSPEVLVGVLVYCVHFGLEFGARSASDDKAAAASIREKLDELDPYGLWRSETIAGFSELPDSAASEDQKPLCRYYPSYPININSFLNIKSIVIVPKFANHPVRGAVYCAKVCDVICKHLRYIKNNEFLPCETAEMYYKYAMRLLRTSDDSKRAIDRQPHPPAQAAYESVVDGCRSIILKLNLGDIYEEHILDSIRRSARREICDIYSDGENNIVSDFKELITDYLKKNKVLNGSTDRVIGALTEAVACAVNASFAPQAKKVIKLAPLPSEAPLKWRRRDRDQFRNPARFILDVYGNWLGSPNGTTGMTRPDLLKIDDELYYALGNWLRNKANHVHADWMALKLRLPTKEERNDAILAAYKEGHSHIGFNGSTREIGRLHSVAQRRKARERSVALG